MQRQTAVRSRIVDLVSGEFVKKEGMEPSYVVTPGKVSICRAMVAGTVVGKFDSEDGNFSSVTLDDATGTIRAKLWREVDLLRDVKVGNLVSLVGKVREYEGEIYIVPEIVREITPDEEALARLGVLKRMKGRTSGGGAPAGNAAQKPAQKAPAEAGAVDARKKVLDVIGNNPDGIKYGDLIQQAGLAEETVEDVINELLGEGVCYEPMPGKIKRI